MICDTCLHNDVCGGEESFDPALTYCADYLGWIPVSERLPTEDEYIANNGLFIVTDGYRTYAEYFFNAPSRKYFGEDTMYGFRADKCVTAWMPLPKPYKPQESENKEK